MRRSAGKTEIFVTTRKQAPSPEASSHPRLTLHMGQNFQKSRLDPAVGPFLPVGGQRWASHTASPLADANVVFRIGC